MQIHPCTTFHIIIQLLSLMDVIQHIRELVVHLFELTSHLWKVKVKQSIKNTLPNVMTHNFIDLSLTFIGEVYILVSQKDISAQ